MKNKINILDFLLVSIVLILVYFRFLFQPINIGNDLHFAYKESFLGQFSIPQTWQNSSGSGLGGNEILLMWSKPLVILSGLIGWIGISFVIVIKLFILFGLLFLGLWSSRKVINSLGLSKYSALISSIFYLTTTYILLIVDGGQIAIALAYALFPYGYYLFRKGIQGKLIDHVLFALTTSLLGFLDIRFILILFILIFINFLFEIRLVSKYLRLGFITVITFCLINSYWLLPLVSNRSLAVPSTYLRESQTSFLNFTELKHSVSLLQPHWYENRFGIIPPFKKEFLVIPLLAFLAPILRRKDKKVWFWTVVALIGVFLTKGANPPLGNIYNWLFLNIPGFSLFRDSTKFFFLVAISYSVLIVFTTEEIIRKLPKLKLIFPFLLIGYFLFLVRPVYLGKMTGTFSEPRYKNEYFSLASKLEDDNDYGRILWIPFKTPLGFSSPVHPSVEANRIESLRPFATATVGAYETQNFIREGEYMDQLFDISGIKYIAYPYFDPKRDDMDEEKVEYYNTFYKQINDLPWIEGKVSDIPIPVFKVKENEDKFFLSGNNYFILGSDRIYTDIKKLAGKFADNALIFLEDKTYQIEDISKYNNSKIILYDKFTTDLALSQVNSNKFISLASQLDFSPNQSGWWKREAVDLVWLRDFMQQKYGIDNLDFDYGMGWAIAEGQKEITLNKNLTSGILYARIMESSKSGEVGFYDGEKLINSFNTQLPEPVKVSIKLTGNDKIPNKVFQYDKADFRWIRVGDVSGENSLTIKTNGDINIVNSLVVITPEEENSLNSRVDKLIKEGKVIDWASLGNLDKKDLFNDSTKAQVSYTYIAPTHYKVSISGLTTPTTLFFSETFDNGWELDNVKGYKLYSLINGFWVEKDGEYDVYFAPQKYMLPGLVISIISLTSCIIILVWSKRNNSKPKSKKSS